MYSLKASPYFSIIANECQDINTNEELKIYFRSLLGEKPEEHFVNIHHITAQDASATTDAIYSFMESNNLEYRKLIGQGYDGATTFSGHKSGVQLRIHTHVPHAIYLHCSCHKLQLASVQAAEDVPETKNFLNDGKFSEVFLLLSKIGRSS